VGRHLLKKDRVGYDLYSGRITYSGDVKPGNLDIINNYKDSTKPWNKLPGTVNG
jgi:hypothetical protein